jgi:hypothetical protein
MDLGGSVLDTFANFSISNGLGFIDNDHVVSLGANEMVGIYSFSDAHFTPLAQTSLGSCFIGPTIKQDEFIWCDKTGIYKTNSLSKMTSQLKLACGTRQYFLPMLNHSKTRIIFSKNIQTSDDDKLFLTYKIVMMDPDGNNETEISIPL